MLPPPESGLAGNLVLGSLSARPDDHAVDVDVAGKPGNPPHALGNVLGPQGRVDALVDLVGHGLIDVETDEGELLGAYHAGAHLADPHRVATQLQP